MRDRLIAAFVGLTVLVITLYGIPRAYFIADLVRDDQQGQVERTADLVAAAVDDHRAAGEPVDPVYLNSLSGPSERIVVRTPDGETVRSTDGPAPDTDDVSATSPVAGGGTVSVFHSAAENSKEVSGALLPLVVLGLGLVLLAGLAGWALARVLSRPFIELAAAARGFGVGLFRPELGKYQIPEAREIAEALRASGEAIDTSLQHERDLAAHASHELRTPVTALRLDLEDLALWPSTPAPVSEALGRATDELDRLSAAIDTLLSRAREQYASAAIDLDLDALVAAVAERLSSDGLEVTYSTIGRLPAHLDPRSAVRLVDDLVTRAASAGTLVDLATADRGTHVEIRVTAPSLPDDPGEEVATMAASMGGQVSRYAGAWTVRLPKPSPNASRP